MERDSQPRKDPSLLGFLDYLEGKKTYIIAVVGIIYIFGGDQGWWKLNEAIASILGFGGIMSLRAGIKKDTAQ